MAQCSKTCGGGTQTRPVTCRDHLGQTVPDHRCHPLGRPDYSQSCKSEPCPTTAPIPEKTYKWKTAHWTTVGRSNSISTSVVISTTQSSAGTEPTFVLEETTVPTIPTLESITTISPTTFSPSTQSTLNQTSTVALKTESNPPVTYALINTTNQSTGSTGSFSTTRKSSTVSSTTPLSTTKLPTRGLISPRPTYVYFANYYRFDSSPMKHSLRP